jgi:hypothetical protein
MQSRLEIGVPVKVVFRTQQTYPTGKRAMKNGSPINCQKQKEGAQRAPSFLVKFPSEPRIPQRCVGVTVTG